MTSETTAKKNIQKLQRAIVDGLEDVKAQNIVVFNTEHLSPLFERVVVASGTSNRQTKALAASVRDAVREAGFPKPRTEGEDNGEWIIVDCGPAVVHVMQPAIRQYYHLEEIWGEKPVRVKHGAEKPVAEVKPAKPAKPVKAASAKEKAPAKAAARTAAKPATKPAAKSAPKPAAKSSSKPATKSAAKPASRAPAKTATKAPAKRVVPAKAGAPARKTPARKAPVKVVKVGTPLKKAAAKKAAPRKPRA